MIMKFEIVVITMVVQIGLNLEKQNPHNKSFNSTTQEDGCPRWTGDGAMIDFLFSAATPTSIWPGQSSSAWPNQRHSALIPNKDYPSRRDIQLCNGPTKTSPTQHLSSFHCLCRHQPSIADWFRPTQPPSSITNLIQNLALLRRNLIRRSDYPDWWDSKIETMLLGGSKIVPYIYTHVPCKIRFFLFVVSLIASFRLG